ncbi:MAG: hypothetical protein E7675_07460 [Ruminococcaceae bacterium]|nr:hypothetical protein [Oscillospiraceae bacterium]
MLFGKKKKDEEEYIKCCGLCEYASEDSDGEFMICSKKKCRVEKNKSCRRFSYDITKRIPKRRPAKFDFEG